MSRNNGNASIGEGQRRDVDR